MLLAEQTSRTRTSAGPMRREEASAADRSGRREGPGPQAAHATPRRGGLSLCSRSFELHLPAKFFGTPPNVCHSAVFAASHISRCSI